MTPPKHVVTELIDGILVVSLRSELGSLTDEHQDDEFDETVQKVKDPQVRNVLMDLAAAGYFGSQVLEWMVVLWKRVREKGGHMAFCNVKPSAREILAVSRFDTIWPIHDTRDDALGSFDSE